VGVPKTFGRPAGSFREPTFDPSKVGGGILDFPTGKSGFPGRESSWYKLLIGRGNPEIKVHLPIIPDFRNYYVEAASLGGIWANLGGGLVVSFQQRYR